MGGGLGADPDATLLPLTALGQLQVTRRPSALTLWMAGITFVPPSGVLTGWRVLFTSPRAL